MNTIYLIGSLLTFVWLLVNFGTAFGTTMIAELVAILVSILIASVWPLFWLVVGFALLVERLSSVDNESDTVPKTFEELFHELRQKEKDAMNGKGDWPYESDYKGD